MKSKFACLLLAAFFALPNTKAHAVAIDYIFTGSGTGTLGGTGFDGAFNFTILGDTGNVDASDPTFVFNSHNNATFTSGALATILTETSAVVNSGNPNFTTLQFAQSQPSPVFGQSEAIVSSTFATYELNAAYPLTGPFTGGGLSVQPQTYLTAAGDLDFSTITSLSFQATEPSSVPLPSGLPMMMAALLGVGFLPVRRRMVKARA